MAVFVPVASVVYSKLLFYVGIFPISLLCNHVLYARGFVGRAKSCACDIGIPAAATFAKVAAATFAKVAPAALTKTWGFAWGGPKVALATLGYLAPATLGNVAVATFLKVCLVPRRLS